MERISGARAENRILHRLIRKAEASYTVSDISKAIGPMIDLMFVSLFIGVRGVTVMGYVSPLIMLFELIGTTLNSGSRNKVSALICAGQQEEANRAFSGSLIAGGGLSPWRRFSQLSFVPGSAWSWEPGILNGSGETSLLQGLPGQRHCGRLRLGD